MKIIIRIIPVFLLVFYGYSTFGQTSLYNDGGTVHVGSNGLLFLDGDMQNEFGTINNLGTMDVSGDWINRDQYNATNQGKVVLFGPISTSLQGNLTGPNAFHILKIQKNGATPANQFVLLMDPTEVSEQLDLTSGRILTDIHELYISNPDLNAIQGQPAAGSVSDDRFVEGNLKRRVSTSGGLYEFPVGDDPQQGFAYNLANVDMGSLSADMDVVVAFQGSKMAISDTLDCTDGYQYLLDCKYGQWQFQDDNTGQNYLYEIQVFPNMAFACDSAIYQFIEADQNYLSDCPTGNTFGNLSSFHSFSLASGKKRIMTTPVDPYKKGIEGVDFRIVNPVNDYQIEGRVTSVKTQSGMIYLYDLSGRNLGELWEGQLIANQTQELNLALPSLAAGLYLIRLDTDNGQSQRIIQLRE